MMFSIVSITSVTDITVERLGEGHAGAEHFTRLYLGVLGVRHYQGDRRRV